MTEESEPEDLERPWTLLQRLLERLEPADGRYLSFQLWQEGMGRYVEWKAAQVAAAGFKPSAEFASLPDAVRWDEAARGEWQRILKGLAQNSLSEDRRVSFYAVGAGLGVLLDRMTPDWKKRYLQEKFAIHRYVESGAHPKAR